MGEGFLEWVQSNAEPGPGRPCTPDDFYAACRWVLEQPAPEPGVLRQVFVGDDFELALESVKRNIPILCSPRVRVLLGEHLP